MDLSTYDLLEALDIEAEIEKKHHEQEQKQEPSSSVLDQIENLKRFAEWEAAQ